VPAPDDLTAPAPPTETIAFGGLTIGFDERVLRPRPWTQRQSQLAARLLATAPEGPVLELCSGAGQIGLLAVLGHDRRLVLVDANPVACANARRNAEAAGRSATTEIRCGSLETVIDHGEMFALVVADPPWVESSRTEDFPADPLDAIDGGRDGLDIARMCVRVAGTHLLAGGSLVLQVGSPAQADALTSWIEAHPQWRLRVREVHDVPGRGTLMVVAHDAGGEAGDREG